MDPPPRPPKLLCLSIPSHCCASLAALLPAAHTAAAAQAAHLHQPLLGLHQLVVLHQAGVDIELRHVVHNHSAAAQAGTRLHERARCLQEGTPSTWRRFW